MKNVLLIIMLCSILSGCTTTLKGSKKEPIRIIADINLKVIKEELK